MSQQAVHGWKRVIRPFLFESGEIVVRVDDLKRSVVERFRVVCRKHHCTTGNGARKRSYNAYQIKSLVSGINMDTSEHDIRQSVTGETVIQVTRSPGHRTAEAPARVQTR